MPNLTEVIEMIVQQQLKPAQIVDLRVTEADDADGDPILRVEVVFKVTGDRLDPEKVLGLVRHLREPLQNKLNEKRFPVFSFVTEDEASDAAA